MLLDDTATYVAANTTRLAVGTNLTKAFLPDTPDTCTAFYESAGLFSLHFFTTSTGTRGYEQPALQVLSRSTDYQTARDTAEDVFTILDGVAGANLPTATGPTYVLIDAVQSPFDAGRDSNDRFQVSVNFNIIKSTG